MYTKTVEMAPAGRQGPDGVGPRRQGFRLEFQLAPAGHRRGPDARPLPLEHDPVAEVVPVVLDVLDHQPR